MNNKQLMIIFAMGLVLQVSVIPLLYAGEFGRPSFSLTESKGDFSKNSFTVNSDTGELSKPTLKIRDSRDSIFTDRSFTVHSDYDGEFSEPSFDLNVNNGEFGGIVKRGHHGLVTTEKTARSKTQVKK